MRFKLYTKGKKKLVVDDCTQKESDDADQTVLYNMPKKPKTGSQQQLFVPQGIAGLGRGLWY